MFSSCTLHIGMEKTGTTSIQGALTKSRAALLEAGLLYPVSMGPDNHTNLIAHARDDDQTDNQRKRALAKRGEALSEFRARIEADLARDAREHAGKRLILSNEHLQSRLTNPREKRRLRDFLGAHCREIDVYLYLRRQDRVAVSLYGTRLRSGSISNGMGNVFPKVSDGLPYFYDYDRIQSEWAEVFGEDRVHVRVFEADALVGRDVLADFRQWVGIGPEVEIAEVGRLNESITVEAQFLMSRMNAINPMFEDDKPNPARASVSQRLDRIAPGRGRMPDRASAERFQAAFEESNRRLFERVALENAVPVEGFGDDFSMYPETENQAVDPEKLADIACRLFRDVAEDLVRAQRKARGK